MQRSAKTFGRSLQRSRCYVVEEVKRREVAGERGGDVVYLHVFLLRLRADRHAFVTRVSRYFRFMLPRYACVTGAMSRHEECYASVRARR